MVRCLARGVWSSSLFLLFRFHLFLFSLISASSSSTPLLFSFLFFSLLFFYLCVFVFMYWLTYICHLLDSIESYICTFEPGIPFTLQ